MTSEDDKVLGTIDLSRRSCIGVYFAKKLELNIGDEIKIRDSDGKEFILRAVREAKE